jgi:hypothetical protein
MPTEPFVDDRTRRTVTRVFRLFEDVIFVGLGLMLACCALYLLAAAAGRFGEHVFKLTLTGTAVVDLIEQLLLILLVVEILYTVQVIGLIAAVRRVLVITAELSETRNNSEVAFRFLMIELGVLTALILALVASVMMLRRKSAPAEAGGHD